MPEAALGPLAAAWTRGARQARHAVGLASRTGARAGNQDIVAWQDGEGLRSLTHGAVALVADGMGGGRGGGLAAWLACAAFMDGYFSLSPTLGVAGAGHRVLASYNRWLYAMAHVDPALAGGGTTFTALVLKGRVAHLLHVGDSRAWRYRDGWLEPLSRDHKPAGMADTPLLSRAIGLEPELRVDHAMIPLEVHDRLLLTSDGAHGPLAITALEDVLDRRWPPERTAEAILDLAMAAGSDDNASVMVIDCLALPDADGAGLAALAAALPVPPAPMPGAVIDGIRLERQLSDGEQTRAFIARRLDGGERLVAKFPRPERTGEVAARAAFVRERLIAGRVDSPHVARILPISPDAQSRVYTLMPFFEGATLEARLKQGALGIAEGLAIAKRLARGIIALHRQGVIHRDIKPDNVMVDGDGGVRLLDFGVALIPRMEEAGDGEVPGTHGYLAPELYEGARGDEASDQFAFGVTLYRIFTGQFPYADLEALRRPGLDSAPDPAELRPDMPAWLAQVLRRAVRARVEDRFDDMIELLQLLEGGSARAVPRMRPPSLMERNPVLVWQTIAALLALGLIGALAAH